MPRYILIQKILWLAHETGKEITEDTLMAGYNVSDDYSEKMFLKDVYKGLLVRWRNHQLPISTDNEDI